MKNKKITDEQFNLRKMTWPKLTELDPEALRMGELPMNLAKFAKVFSRDKDKLGVIEQGNQACIDLKDRLSQHWDESGCPRGEKPLINMFGETCERFKPDPVSSSDSDDDGKKKKT